MRRRKSKFQKQCLCIGLVLVFGATVIACSGFQTKYKYTRADKIAIGGLIVATAADVGTTINGLNSGARETNPIAGEDPSSASLILINVAVTGALIYLSQWWTSQERQMLWVPTLFHGFAAGHNYQVTH